MARAAGSYSRIVAWLKVLLPLVALALLSTLFLLSRSNEPALDVPFAEALGAGETARERIGAPFFSGTTARGDALTMTASAARPQGAGVIEADALSARLLLSDGSRIELRSDRATLEDESRSATLSGDVQITSSNGYVLSTDALWSSIERTEAQSLGPVTGSGPHGTLSAGRMRIEEAAGTGDVQFLFTGGVKLVYDPQP